MKIKILYLYYDLMNLYGESGNVRALVRHLKDQGLEVELDGKSLNDNIDFSKYDLIYCGSGTESKQKVAMAHLNKYIDSFKQAAEDNKIILFTGTAFEMLGKCIISGSGNKYEGLGIFDFTVKQSSFRRITGDVIARFSEIKSPIVGFINKCSEINEVSEPLFTVDMGAGNRQRSKDEGARYKNVIGTHITGPILIKNPRFMEYLIRLLEKILPGFNFEHIDYPYEQKAYKITLSELRARD